MRVTLLPVNSKLCPSDPGRCEAEHVCCRLLTGAQTICCSVSLCLYCCLQEDDDITSLASEDSEPSEAESAELWGRHLPSPFEDPTAVQSRPKQPSPEKRREEVSSLGQLRGSAVGAATCIALSCPVMWAASAYEGAAGFARGSCCIGLCCWAGVGMLKSMCD